MHRTLPAPQDQADDMTAAPDIAPERQSRASVSNDLCSSTVRYVRLDAIEVGLTFLVLTCNL